MPQVLVSKWQHSLPGFAARMQAAMHTAHLSGADLAVAVDTSGATISRYAHGTRQPTASILLRIAYRLDVSPYWLLFGEDFSRE